METRAAASVNRFRETDVPEQAAVSDQQTKTLVSSNRFTVKLFRLHEKRGKTIRNPGNVVHITIDLLSEEKEEGAE